MALEIENARQNAKKAYEQVKNLEHKLQVQHTLRDQFKEFIKENMEVFDPNNAHLIKEKMGFESLLDPISQMSQGPHQLPNLPMRSDTAYNERMTDHMNLGARSVQTSITPALKPIEKGEVKEGYHSRIPTNNANEFLEGSVSARSRNIHEVTGQLSEMFGGSNFTTENLVIGHSAK